MNSQYLKDFLIRYEYPDDSHAYILKQYETLRDHRAYDDFSMLHKLYNSDKLEKGDALWDTLREISDKSGVHYYTVQLLFLISLTKHLKTLYKKRCYLEEDYHSAVLDIQWRMLECHKVYGVWGVFVGWWIIDFFLLIRFSLGRLQFELIESKLKYVKNDITINIGDPVIDVHIPSSGPLIREEYLKSYDRAAEFFNESFQESPCAFVCHSWLLYPDNLKILPKSSRILPFMADFDIISCNEDEARENIWRIFYVEKIPENVDMLPQDTSLQRAFFNWIKSGRSMGVATGIFLYKDGRFYK